MSCPHWSWGLHRCGIPLLGFTLLILLHFSQITRNIPNLHLLRCWYLWIIWFLSFMVQLHMSGISSILGSLRRLNHHTVTTLVIAHMAGSQIGWSTCLLVVALTELCLLSSACFLQLYAFCQSIPSSWVFCPGLDPFPFHLVWQPPSDLGVLCARSFR